MHLINQNSPVQNSVCYNQGKEIDSSVVLHINVVVEVDPQVLEVAHVEESDVVFEDAQVDVYDVLDHDDVKITAFVVNDSVVASSHLTKNVTQILHQFCWASCYSERYRDSKTTSSAPPQLISLVLRVCFNLHQLLFLP